MYLAKVALSLIGITAMIALPLYFRPRKAIPIPEVTVTTPTPTASPSATPTPKPLTFAEMNQLYGPCVSLPILMYHHLQPSDQATKNGQMGLTVTPETFAAHLEYLTQKGYHPITPDQLLAFFTQNQALPGKPIMLTFDDAYSDFADFAYPLLNQYHFPATMFVPTGLVDNGGYLSWSQISSLAGSGLITFGNHTWSHAAMSGNVDKVVQEISTAQQQLSSHGLNSNRFFAYPYGSVSSASINALKQQQFTLAFTTVNGRTQCKQLPYKLTRIRIGNAPLKNFGL